MKIIDRESARVLGLKRYFDGKLCIKQHESERLVSNKGCIKCRREIHDFRMKNDPAYFNAQKIIHKRIQKRNYSNRTEERKEETRKNARTRYHANLDKSREKSRLNATKNRLNPKNRMKYNMSYYIWRFIDKKGQGTSQIIYERCGYTIDQLRDHIEKQFVSGMSWDNYGRDGWHIDHIIPSSTFDMDNHEDFRACWSLCNLRPLWAKDNKIKNAKAMYLI
jgi:hypothetical protein